MIKGKLIYPKSNDIWEDFKLLCNIKGKTLNEQINILINDFIEENSKILKGVKNDRS